MQPAWARVFDQADNAAPTLHFDWLWTWWNTYARSGESGERLQILTARRGADLVGVLPLYSKVERLAFQRLRTLRFLSTGEMSAEETCADYLDALCLPDQGAECSLAFQNAASALEWDLASLVDFSARSPLRSWTDLDLPDSNWRLEPRGACPIADLSSGFEAYVKGLSSKSRERSRQNLRQVAKAEISIEFAEKHNFDEFFNDFVQLHQGRWNGRGKAGCFAAPRFREFHQSLCQKWIPEKRAIIMRLRQGPRPLAAIYGFVAGRSFHFYQSGIDSDENGPLMSPGIAANLVLMRHLAERGIATYDFLRGAQAYKQRLATSESQLCQLTAARSNLRVWLFQTKTRAANTVRSWLRRPRSGTAAQHVPTQPRP